MRIYYQNDGKIIKVYSEQIDFARPEDSPKTAINVPYSVLEFDEKYNRLLAHLLLRNSRGTPQQPLPDRFSVNASGQLVNNDTKEIVTINPNPEREAYKASALYKVTPAQAATWVQDKINAASTLSQLKTALSTILPEMARATVYLARQSKLED